MNENTLHRIRSFQGDIRSGFELIVQEYPNFGFTLKTNFFAVSNPFESFANTVRIYRSKGLIDPVEKHGVRLILTGKNTLQYLLIQRLLAIGAKLEDLKTVLPRLDDKQLEALICTQSLSLASVPGLCRKLSTKATTASSSTVSSSMPVWYQVRLTKGIQVNINANEYSVEDVENIRQVFKAALDRME